MSKEGDYHNIMRLFEAYKTRKALSQIMVPMESSSKVIPSKEEDSGLSSKVPRL